MDSIEEIKAELLKEALDRHGEIYPVRDYKFIEDGYITDDTHISLWFNLASKSTSCVYRRINYRE